MSLTQFGLMVFWYLPGAFSMFKTIDFHETNLRHLLLCHHHYLLKRQHTSKIERHSLVIHTKSLDEYSQKPVIKSVSTTLPKSM